MAGFFDYIADENNVTEPAQVWEEREEPQTEAPAEKAARIKGELEQMLSSNAPLSDLIITALQAVGELTESKAWADKQCGDLMFKLTAENRRGLDLLSWELSARDLEAQEKKILAQIKGQQTKFKAISTHLDEIAAAANWKGEILSIKDLYTSLDEHGPAQDGEQLTMPGIE